MPLKALPYLQGGLFCPSHKACCTSGQHRDCWTGSGCRAVCSRFLSVTVTWTGLFKIIHPKEARSLFLIRVIPNPEAKMKKTSSVNTELNVKSAIGPMNGQHSFKRILPFPASLPTCKGIDRKPDCLLQAVFAGLLLRPLEFTQDPQAHLDLQNHLNSSA